MDIIKEEFEEYIDRVAGKVKELIMENSTSKGIRLTVRLDTEHDYATIDTNVDRTEYVTRHRKADEVLKKVAEVFGNE